MTIANLGNTPGPGRSRMFRTRPEVVEAYILTEDNLEVLEKWCGGSIKGILLPRGRRVIDIQTRAGECRACIGDWIIKGKGEYYPCEPGMFRRDYEEVPSEN